MARSGQTSVHVMEVTPVLAGAWLKKNTHNRPLRRGHVDDLKRRVERGEWQLSNDAIALASDGQVLNGQHRLTMITELDRPLPLLVMIGSKKELQRIIDGGWKRNFSQSLAMDSEKNALLLAAAASWVWKYDGGWLTIFRGNHSTRPSQDELYEVLEWHPGIRRAVEWTSTAPLASERMLMGPASVMAAFYHLISRIDIERAEAFMNGVIGEGVGMEPNIRLLRQKLATARLRGPKQARITIPSWMVFSYYTKTWNAHINGKVIKNLVMGPKEACPKIAGYEAPAKNGERR